MSVSILEQAKIQAQVLVPLIKALREELGEARANALVRGALGEVYRRQGEAMRRETAADVGQAMGAAFKAYARDGALDSEVLEQSADSFSVNITGCRYAEFYKALGEPELGFLLVCSADFDVAAGLDPDLQLTRGQTIMQGAGHCDFRYRRTPPKAP